MIKKYKTFYESNENQTLESIAAEFECRIDKVGKVERLFFTPGNILIDDLINFFEAIANVGDCIWWSEGRDFVFEFETTN
jgi:hypothetical protein